MRLLQEKYSIKRSFREHVIIAFLILFNLQLAAQTKADDITGVWLTRGKEPAKIQIFKSGDRYYGKIIWLENPTENDKPRVDKKNQDKNKQSQQIVGLIILENFRFNNSDEWNGGKIYDPESGKTYNCYLSLKNETTLKVRGYIGISFFGRTEIWSKVK